MPQLRPDVADKINKIEKSQEGHSTHMKLYVQRQGRRNVHGGPENSAHNLGVACTSRPAGGEAGPVG